MNQPEPLSKKFYEFVKDAPEKFSDWGEKFKSFFVKTKLEFLENPLNKNVQEKINNTDTSTFFHRVYMFGKKARKKMRHPDKEELEKEKKKAEEDKEKAK